MAAVRAVAAFIGVVGLLHAAPALAFDSGTIEHGRPLEDGKVIGEDATEILGGMVIRQTVTHWGDEFYRYFARSWRQQQVGAHRPVTVEEHPSAQNGSRIRVKYGRDVLFDTIIRLRGQTVADIAEWVAGHVAARVSRRLVAGSGSNGRDLAEEEL